MFNADENYYIVTVDPPDSRSRRFLSLRFTRVWDNSPRVCFYAGSGQGGRSGMLPEADDSVIEGNYREYLVEDLYAHVFTYAEFEYQRCTNA